MKRKLKLTSVLLTLCLLMSLPMVVFAAEGRMSFTDLTSPAGEEFNITINMTADVGIGTIDVVFDYDNQAIEFLNGENLSASNSQLTYHVESDGSETTIKTIATFMALKNTDTKIKIAELTVTDVNGDAIDTIEGSSAISIEGGTEVESSVTETTTLEPVIVDGAEYYLCASFDESLLPDGYVISEISYNDTVVSVAKDENSGIVLGYLEDVAGEGTFFCYNAEENSFSPYVCIQISDSSYLVFTDEAINATLPTNYVETTVTISGYVFPTWEDTDNSGFYLINAIDGTGNVSIYQYDTQDQTYQRFIVPEVEVEEVVEYENETVGAVIDFIEMNLTITLIAIGGMLAFLLLVMIILGVKLSNRNRELDDLYDEYEDKMDAPVVAKTDVPVKKAERQKATKKSKEQAYYEDSDDFEDEYDDDFDDYDDDEFDDYDDHDFEDDFEDGFDEYDDEEDDFDDDEFDDYDDDDYDDSDDFDDIEEVRASLKGNNGKPGFLKNRKKNNDIDNDDIDFIDL